MFARLDLVWRTTDDLRGHVERRRPTRRQRARPVKWVIPTACVLGVLAIGLFFLFFLRNTPRTFNWADAGCTVANAPGRDNALGNNTVVCFPDADAETVDYWKTARETCKREGFHRLAAYLQVRLSGPVPVARKYTRWLRAPGGRLARTTDERKLRAVYEGCLQGFKERL
jgi:hypothetical protein